MSISRATRVFVALVVCPVFCGVQSAAASTQPAGGRADGLTVRVHSRLGLPVFVTAADGAAIPAARGGVQPAPQATDFFAAHGDVFGVSDPASQLMQTRVETDPLGWTHTSFQQVHQGIPVFSGSLKVHQDAAGQIRSVNGRFYPMSPKFDVHASLDAESGAVIAVGEMAPAAVAAETTELVIVDPGWYGDSPMGAHLAYHVIVSNAMMQVREAFFIDAHTGEVLDRWSLVCDALFRQVYDASGGGLPGVLVRDEDGPPPTPPTGDDEVDRAFDYGGDTYYYFYRGFGRDSINGAGMNIVQSVHRTFSCPNASWNGVQASYCDGVTPDDVIGHELTHGVTQFTAGLIYQNQSGQLNESFSDVFGEMIDLFNGDAAFPGPPGGTPWPLPPAIGPGTDVPNNQRTMCSPRPEYPDGVRWLVGDDATAFGGAIRDMWDPTCRNHPDRANSPLQTCPANDAGGVHSGSGVPNHAFAILTDGKTFNGYTVSGIGPIKSGAVWYRALAVYLTPSSDFEDAYFSFTQAALDLVGMTPADPRTGDPSDSVFTSSDAYQVELALLATEMNTPGACGAGDDVLTSAAAPQCPTASIVYSNDFEEGAAGWTVSNSGPPTPYDWALSTAALPFARPGVAMFCPDPNLGNCTTIDESGLHSLFSPVIDLPAGGDRPMLSFVHYLATEGGWDTGNVKIAVNGGGWQLVPRTAFRHNGYNGRTNPVSGGNTNPLSGEDGWTGAGGQWGSSVIDLGGLVSPGDALQIRFDLGKDGCTGVMGWFVDDVTVFTCPDCDGDGIDDMAAAEFTAASGMVGNIGSGSPQSVTFVAPPEAATDVLLAFNARGDFSATSEFVDVEINGTFVGTVLSISAGDCPQTPEREQMVVPAAVFNAAVAGGDAVISLTASSDVNPALGQCQNQSYIGVSIRFGRPMADCNGNLAQDGCEAAAGGAGAFVDVLLGVSPYACIYDFNASGAVDGDDIEAMVALLIGG